MDDECSTNENNLKCSFYLSNVEENQTFGIPNSRQ